MILRGVPLHVLLSTRVPDTSTTWARELHHLLLACSLLVVLGQVKVMSSASFMSTLNAHTRNLATCMLAAPTGVAAFNISGLTIHCALNLPVEHDRSTAYKKLSAERLHELRRLWKDVHVMIIDEFSMVSYQTFTFIHKRLAEIVQKTLKSTLVESVSSQLVTSFNYHLSVIDFSSRMARAMSREQLTCGVTSSPCLSSPPTCARGMIPPTLKSSTTLGLGRTLQMKFSFLDRG